MVTQKIATDIAAELAKRPRDILQPIQKTEIIEKPIERIIEIPPEPLQSMTVKRGKDGYIREISSSKGSFKVTRDDRGMITGVVRK
jgi:hypothetical protein